MLATNITTASTALAKIPTATSVVKAPRAMALAHRRRGDGGTRSRSSLSTGACSRSKRDWMAGSKARGNWWIIRTAEATTAASTTTLPCCCNGVITSVGGARSPAHVKIGRMSTGVAWTQKATIASVATAWPRRATARRARRDHAWRSGSCAVRAFAVIGIRTASSASRA